MIQLLVIVPYPELYDEVTRILNLPKYQSKINASVQVITVENIPHAKVDGYDLIVARGYTVHLLNQRKSLHGTPVLPLPITGYDILRAAQECRKIVPEGVKIAYIGKEKDVHPLSTIPEILNSPVCGFACEEYLELPKTVQRAVESGCQAIIGGYSATQAAKSMGIPSVFLRTGEEAICQVLDEAIHITRMAEARHIKNELYKTLIHSSSEGMIYVSKEGQILIENPAALTLTNMPYLKTLSLASAFPVMEASFQKVLSSGVEITTELQKINNATLSISYNPIMSKKNVIGVMILFQDITRIQQQEGRIRKTLSDKGLRAKYTFDNIIHESSIMKDVLRRARSYAQTQSNIMLLGESGTGKEVFAQSIHNASTRKNGPFVAINCAALPENLLESELFGYVPGAFTGSGKNGKMGLFELAHGGTLFLDEISEVSINVQSKLLRVLQEREVRRIGDDRVIAVDVRIICATNRNLNQLVLQGRFRQDLMYRLDVLRIFIPPLRKREEDMLLIFQSQLAKLYHSYEYTVPQLCEEAKQMLLAAPFYGNVRELRNIAERISAIHEEAEYITAEELALALNPEDVELIHQIPESAPRPAPAQLSRHPEDSDILAALRRNGGNQRKAAQELGIDRSTLWRRMKKMQK